MTNENENSIYLGEESQPIDFPLGLIGLEEWRRFSLVSHPAGEPLRLLQALDDPRVSLIVTDPRQLVPGYQLSLSGADVQGLKYSGESGPLAGDVIELDVYCILSIQADPFYVTANLLGPLVINWQSGLGRQIVLSDSRYSPRFLVASASEEVETTDLAMSKEVV
ncbi:MAG TPA: flagellar assembly protein FliW [Anaerolineae bacterium]|nr:flagellar assembly protein FliW [Anaerolineae bacterium]